MEWMGLWKKKMSIGFCCNIEQKKVKNSWLKWSCDAANNLPMTPKVIWRKSAISSSCVPADTAKVKNYTRKYGRQRKSYNLPYLTKAAVWGEFRMFNLVCVDTNAVAADLCDVCHVTGVVHRSPNQRLSQLSQ